MNREINDTHINRILVVDDTPENLRLLTDILTEQGYTVHPASDGELALEFIRSTVPDLILLDIRMPEMDGYEVCRRLKADERTRSIPIIFISILEDQRDKVKGFKEGAVDYITKPFEPEEVLLRVRTHLHLRDLTVRLEQKVNEQTAALTLAIRELRDEVAERMKAEEELRFTNAILRTQQEASQDGILVVDEWGKIILFNQRFVDMWGIPPEVVKSRSDESALQFVLGRLIRPEEFLAKVKYLYEHREERSQDELALVSDVTFDRYSSPMFGPGGEYYGRVWYFRDITERKLAEKALQEKHVEVEHLKNYLANIINSMPSVLVGIDNNQTVSQWNRQAEEMTGIPVTEAVGKPISHLLPDFSPWITAMGKDIHEHHPASESPSDRSEHQRAEGEAGHPLVGAALPAEGATRAPSIEKLLIEKEGERRFYDLMLYPLLTNGVEGTVIRIEDVTERARIQELMIQTEKMMSVGGLAAGMAHEINNPLGIITQAIQNIERRVSPDLAANQKVAEELGVSLEGIDAYFKKRQMPQFIHSIRAASSRAAKIVSNMLQFSRRAETTMQYASLSGIIDQALELAAGDYDLKKKYDFKSIEIVRDYVDMPEVNMVLVEMEQVVLNLLKNAAQAMTVNPPDRKPRIILRLRREDRYALLEVEDNGSGMEEDIRRRVFEPFFTTKEPGIGTGLGLSVAYMIVTQNHKGLMEVISTPGKGSCFRVRLPVA